MLACSQVHRARLSTGEEVAVKLQYPNLARAVAADLAVMKVFRWGMCAERWSVQGPTCG